MSVNEEEEPVSWERHIVDKHPILIGLIMTLFAFYLRERYVRPKVR